MQLLIVSGWFLLLLNQSVHGLYFGTLLGRQKLSDNKSPTDSEPPVSFKTTIIRDTKVDFHFDHSTAGYRSDEKYSKSTQGSSPTGTSQIQSTELSKTEMENYSVVTTSNSQIQTEIFDNETHPNASEEYSSSSTAVTMSTNSLKSSTSSVMTTSVETNASISMKEDNDPERVVIGNPFIQTNGTSITPEEKSLYQKTLEMISDTYTLSILVPVAAGVLFAITIIATIATCKCLKRQCRRRRLRKRVLPDSVRHLRPSDRARLLAESSDEEF